MTPERKLLLLAAASLRQMESIQYRDRIPGSYRMNITDLLEEHLGIEIGMDGDQAFARIGPNLQSGEAEFVRPADASQEAQWHAQAEALNRLVGRLTGE